MTRSILAGLLGLFSIAAVGALPLACQSGGIGDPCIPEDEYSADFAGFKVTEENIESRSFQCSTRICLVNHFQGRVTCPLGQVAPTPCDGLKDTSTCENAMPALGKCVEAGTFAPDCDPKDDHCPDGTKCDANRKVCACFMDSKPGYHCVLSNPADAKSISVFKAFVCHKAGDCQAAGSDPKADATKKCCVPGTDTPTTTSVCSQCTGTSTAKSHRSADQSVYCSCRCGVADGAADEPNFNFCECPTGFTCDQVRPDVGIGDPLLSGKYCIKEGTKFKGDTVGECGQVAGYKDSTCEGSPAAK
jgi:hypothetical protein